MPMMQTRASNIILDNQRSKYFYNILLQKKACRSYMEKTWELEFGVMIDHRMWANIYRRNFKRLPILKLNEFKFKLIHGLVMCNDKLFKWKLESSNQCQWCNLKQDIKHLFFECNSVKKLWQDIGKFLRIDLQWKHLVIGFDESNKTCKFRNLILAITLYSIYISYYKSKKKTLIIIQCNMQRYILWWTTILLISLIQKETKTFVLCMKIL